jgi:predicted DNA-binding transcriptional regulator AlpA
MSHKKRTFLPRTVDPLSHFREQHPLRIIRPTRLAELFSVDVSTIWRWRQNGVLPPPVEISPAIRGWLESEIRDLLEKRRQEANNV